MSLKILERNKGFGLRLWNEWKKLRLGITTESVTPLAQYTSF